MSTRCFYCGETSFYACSRYSGTELEKEIRTCPNLNSKRRHTALVLAGVSTESDDALNELQEAVVDMFSNPEDQSKREKVEQLVGWVR